MARIGQTLMGAHGQSFDTWNDSPGRRIYLYWLGGVAVADFGRISVGPFSSNSRCSQLKRVLLNSCPHSK